MKKHTCCMAVIFCFLGIAALAGPSLPITKPPVADATILTGPAIDPPALQGQWFDDGDTEEVRTHEFYDNPNLEGFSRWAIYGYVTNIVYNFIGDIEAFTILATIQNNTDEFTEWTPGDNSHGESLNYQDLPYIGTLHDVKLTAEFAITDMMNLPAFWIPPYRDREPFIVAENEDQAAWYCWSPDNPSPDLQWGDYYVPTWDFGDIPVGQSATRVLEFTVPGGLPSWDGRFNVIVDSFTTQADILMNRTHSLKISTWIDELYWDYDVPGEFPLRNSNVSVFHNIEEELLDFGDAPDPTYPTLLVNDGARHTVVPGIHLGLLIDAEPDGQPHPNAVGDDINNLPDEDGVTFLTQLIPGQIAQIDVVASVTGFLSAWIDYNGNGSWADPGENVFVAQGLSTGTNTLTFTVPASAAIGNTFARFRFTTIQTPVSFTGWLADGEVEDYEVAITEEPEALLDFGDAWDSGVGPGYPTFLVNNGARHIIVPGVHLGQFIDAEPDGQPTPGADGDDLNPAMGPDDEDGILLPPVMYATSVVTVEVVASVSGFLNAWVDWNANMMWEPHEHLFINHPLPAGTNSLIVNVPPAGVVQPGGPHSRWRFTTYPPAVPSFTGLELDGEVEDYEVHLEVADFGDAPAPYPTLLANDGARHRIPSGYWLGVTPPDEDPDGQPHPQALGDDLANAADEDGVAVGQIIRGTNAVFLVTASTNTGVLNAWIDFDGNGSWLDAGEQIATNMLLATGANSVTSAIPADAQLGPTFARFRYGSQTGLQPTGIANDGEVEDYMFIIEQTGPSTDIVITNIAHGATAGDIDIGWYGELPVAYETQYTTNDLTEAGITWTPWGPYVETPPYVQTDSGGIVTMKFYRVIAPYAIPAP